MVLKSPPKVILGCNYQRNPEELSLELLSSCFCLSGMMTVCDRNLSLRIKSRCAIFLAESIGWPTGLSDHASRPLLNQKQNQMFENVQVFEYVIPPEVEQSINKNDTFLIGTHAESFHLDETLACALLMNSPQFDVLFPKFLLTDNN